MNFKNFTNFRSLILIGIIVIAIVLRFWQLGNVPASPDWDEAALGYNAYSIMLTGKDEYGKSFPVILRSFDDYKPALYAYILIPFIKLFDLNTVAVRLPAAIFGVLGVFGAYLLVRELVKEKRGEPLALLAAGLLAISPWDIQFSRIAFEAHVGMVLNLFAVLFFIKGLRRGYFLSISAILAAASIYMYQSEKVYLPILLAALCAIYFRQILKVDKKWIITAIFIGLIACLPLAHSVLTDQNALLRAKGVSVFSDQTTFLKRNANKIAVDKRNGDLIGQVVDNRRVEFVKAVVAGYIAHFSPNWLFVTGDIERHHAPGMGLLYLFEFPFLLLGIYLLIFGNFDKRTKLTIFAIFLIAPIPASVTSGVPHAVRTINFLPTFQILTAIGILAAYEYIRVNLARLKTYDLRRYFILLGLTSYILFAVFNFSYFLNQYFVQQNYYYSEYWQYGYKQAIDFINPIKNQYNKIVVTNLAPLDQSYMFFLFYLKIDPAEYQRLGGTESGGFKEEHRGFENLTFRPIDFEKEESGTLLIGRESDFPKDLKELFSVDYLNGKEAIKIVEK